MIRDYTDLEILGQNTEEGDAYLFASKDKRIAFVTGHPEYDAQTLAQEYFRDVEAGLGPEVPYNYFPHNDLAGHRERAGVVTDFAVYQLAQLLRLSHYAIMITAHESNAGLIFCDSRSLSDSTPYLSKFRVPFLFPKRTSGGE